MLHCRVKGGALQDSEDISYNGTESSGTSGRQLKLINYRLLVLSQPDKSLYASVTLPQEFSTADTRYYAHFLNTYSVQIGNNF